MKRFTVIYDFDDGYSSCLGATERFNTRAEALEAIANLKADPNSSNIELIDNEQD